MQWIVWYTSLKASTRYYMPVVLWLNANFRTGYRKWKFGKKPGTFDIVKAKTSVFKYVHEL